MYDGNGNGTIDIEDFLGILGLFGDVDVDSDGLWDSQDGCTDIEACNYLEPLAGICTYPDVLGDCSGNCSSDADGDGVCDVFACGDPVSYQGYDYATVLIGDQCWFAENLRSENYENGDAISGNVSSTAGAVTIYGDGENCWMNSNDGTSNAPNGDACDPVWSLSTYGRLYNWYAVNDERGLCPSGWHVPTDGEWTEMTDFLGGASVAAVVMKTNFGWAWDGNGDNSSGFTGLPGGLVWPDGEVGSAGDSGYWWSSSQEGSRAWLRGLISSDSYVNRTKWFLEHGLSIRCIQDSE